MAQIEKTQLERIHSLRVAYATAKLRIAEIEIEKQGIFIHLSKVSEKISEEEDAIKAEFGDDAVIDLKTGEVTNGNS
jgi:predicted  nucleic acid-binding Zn-ribbon protein